MADLLCCILLLDFNDCLPLPDPNPPRTTSCGLVLLATTALIEVLAFESWRLMKFVKLSDCECFITPPRMFSLLTLSLFLDKEGLRDYSTKQLALTGCYFKFEFYCM